jgi:ABC-type cobalamin/Fe3+-siderophores transport system ATPase subunit
MTVEGGVAEVTDPRTTPAPAELTTADGFDVRCIGLSVILGEQRVLDGLDLHVPAGTITTVVGASGSGKSTLVEVILGVQSPDEGSVTIGSHDLGSAPEDELIELGRRVSVLHNVPLYVLDEPDIALDDGHRAGIIEALRHTRERTGATMVIVTDDLVLTEAVSHRVAVLAGGGWRSTEPRARPSRTCGMPCASRSPRPRTRSPRPVRQASTTWPSGPRWSSGPNWSACPVCAGRC